ncbi:MAG TPA: hypothetical protein VNC50_22140 [Planctomycetia bacterium]|nr:hypothetical protein [Planctomycetia bacterium]
MPTSLVRTQWWIAGLLACIVAGSFAAGRGNDKDREWLAYYAAGTAFPVGVAFVSFAPTWGPVVKAPLALAGVAGTACLISGNPSARLLLVAAAQAGAAAWMSRRRDRWGVAGLASMTLALWFAWVASAHMMGRWWDPEKLFDAGHRWGLVAALLGAFCLTAVGMTRRSDGPRQWRRAFDALALLVFAAAAMRTDQLFPADDAVTYCSVHHWALFVGPAELVRQGGWLLWDVPSWYGFLSICAVAAMPFESVWHSLCVLNAFLIFLSAVLVYAALRRLGHGLCNRVFAAVLTFSVVFFIPGFADRATGPQIWPSTGAFRFIWCYVLVALLVFARDRRSQAVRGRVLFAGCMAWTCALLWSAESAVFATAVWLPGFLVFAWHSSRKPEAGRLRAFAAWASVPAALAAAAIGGIEAWYRLRLGNRPDWEAMFETSRAFRAGVMQNAVVPLDPAGPVLWTLLLAVAAAFLCVHALCRRDIRGLAVSLGAWGCLLGTSSFLVARGNTETFVNLAPIMTGLVAVMLRELRRATGTGAATVRLSVCTLLVALLWSSIDRAGLIAVVARGALRLPDANVEVLLPRMEPRLVEFLSSAGVKPGDPVALLDSVDPLPAWPDSPATRTPSWLPFRPPIAASCLKRHRIQRYMDRFFARTGAGGYLLIRKDDASEPFFKTFEYSLYERFITEHLDRSHDRRLVKSSAEYELFWYEPKQGR